MPVRALLGMETEYAVTGMTQGGCRVPQGVLVDRLLAAARVTCPHLGDGGSGLFLANGARLYVDRGDHPEYATPECQDPWEAVRQVRAGEALLQQLGARVRAVHRELRELNFFRCNVDYRRSGASWGCHESYLHRLHPQQLPKQLVPHLVSRQIYAGAGGFHPLSPGLQFTLSPRAWLFGTESSTDSTANRGIFHVKDESLSGLGWHRLHVICGESLCSDTALLLKLGATALVLAAAEEGFGPGPDVRLASPVQALHTVAAGLDRRQGLALANGSRLSAAEIQREYLAAVQRCRKQGLLPGWAAAICELWQLQLDAIESEAPSLEHTLDWALKRALYRRWSRDRFSWDRFAQCTAVLHRLEQALHGMLEGELPVTLEGMLGAENAFRRELNRLEPILAAENLGWADLRAFVRLRRELLEIDFRFGQLGTGIFAQLDRSGVLTHRVNGAAPRSPAPGEAPAGRARVRGEWIGRLWASGDWHRYRCGWDALRDGVTGRWLDLSNPFAETAEWRRE